MEALFNSHTKFVGWIYRDKYILDADLNWVAFIDHDHAWSAKTVHWLGPMDGLNCLDCFGHPVAWHPSLRIRALPSRAMTVTPKVPASPAKQASRTSPATPATPETPVGGWSRMTWSQWLKQ